MVTSIRSLLLRSAGAVALFAAGTAAASAQTAINGGGSTLATPTYEAAFVDAALTNFTFNYFSSGSGPAQNAFLTNTIIDFGGTAPSTGTVDFAASDATLSATQISTFQTAFGNTLIQIPTMGTPITLPFEVGTGFTTDGSINLTDNDVCGIFSGKITNWSGIDRTHSETAPTSGALSVVYRADGSGTSFLLLQHLAAVCNSTNSSFPGATTTSAGFTPTTAFSSVFSTVPSNFVAATGSPGVQAAILANAGGNTIGYLSPDFTQVATDSQLPGAPASPPVADVNGILPNTNNTKLALGSGARPADVTQPADWVPAVPKPTAGYPIVGWTTWELSSCYANANVGAGIVAFLDDFYNVTNSGEGPNVIKEIGNRGFVPVTGSSATASVVTASLAGDIFNNFLTNTSGNGLNINTTANCTAAGAR